MHFFDFDLSLDLDVCLRCEAVVVATCMTQCDTQHLMASCRPAVVIFNLLGYVSQQQHKLRQPEFRKMLHLTPTSKHTHTGTDTHTHTHRQPQRVNAQLLPLCRSKPLLSEENNKRRCWLNMNVERSNMKTETLSKFPLSPVNVKPLIHMNIFIIRETQMTEFVINMPDTVHN